jgi:hypothetical protein
MRPAWLLTAALAATGAVASCGGSDEDKVKDTVTGYLSALADGNGDEACRQLTGDARREVADTAGMPSCQQTISAVADNLDDSEKDRLRDAKIARVKVTKIKRECSKLVEGLCRGPTAIVRVDGADRDVELEQSEGGDWLISGGFGFSER